MPSRHRRTSHCSFEWIPRHAQPRLRHSTRHSSTRRRSRFLLQGRSDPRPRRIRAARQRMPRPCRGSAERQRPSLLAQFGGAMAGGGEQTPGLGSAPARKVRGRKSKGRRLASVASRPRCAASRRGGVRACERRRRRYDTDSKAPLPSGPFREGSTEAHPADNDQASPSR
jgi:hypothetical protein